MADALPAAAPVGAEALGPAEPCRTGCTWAGGLPAAVATRVRLALRADLAMRAQAASQAEGLSAHLAAEGLLASVVPLVSQKVRDPPEGPAALETLEDLGSRVTVWGAASSCDSSGLSHTCRRCRRPLRPTRPAPDSRPRAKPLGSQLPPLPTPPLARGLPEAITVSPPVKGLPCPVEETGTYTGWR